MERVVCAFFGVMRKLIGFILFWIAVGMIIMLFLSSEFIGVLLILLCLIIGYNLFCC